MNIFQNKRYISTTAFKWLHIILLRGYSIIYFSNLLLLDIYFVPIFFRATDNTAMDFVVAVAVVAK